MCIALDTNKIASFIKKTYEAVVLKISLIISIGFYVSFINVK